MKVAFGAERLGFTTARPMAAPSCSADGLFASSASAEADMLSFRSLLAADLQNYTDRVAALAPAMQPTGNFVKRIKANERGSVFDRNFKCLKPAKDLADLNWQHAFDRELLMLKLRRGRITPPCWWLKVGILNFGAA